MADWWDAYPVHPTDATSSPAATDPNTSGNWWAAYPTVPNATAPKPIEAASPNPPMSEGMKYVANAVTGLNNSIGVAGGLPHSIAAIGDWVGSKLGASPEPGFLTRHTYSPEEINNAVNRYGGPVTPEALMSSDPDLQAAIAAPKTAYKPETFWGKVGQGVLSTAPLALLGGGGIPAAITRQVANAAGVTAGEGTKEMFPDSPGMQMAATLFGAFLGDRALPVAAGTASTVANTAGKLWGAQGLADKTAAQKLVNTAGVPGTDLVSQIDQNMPTWEFPNQTLQPKPTTDTVVQNPGLLGLTYNDMAAARSAGDSRYAENAKLTNQAQRQAIDQITPDIAPETTQASDNLTKLVTGLPAGTTAQDAGASFRQQLQNVYDQRLDARRQLGSNVFDALDSNPAQISLRPIMDYATEQAAQNAGEVGSAYTAAGNQFKSGTGITLDTAPFANSALKGLGDLSQSYPVGSAAQRAVLDVKGRAENAIFDQAPEIGTARDAYAAASRPLDVFNPQNTPGPIANAVQTTRFGGYVSPNDTVVSSFLRGNGAPDAIDRLNSVFPDVKSATSSLQDYIASQVQARAINRDGSVNQAALDMVVKPYETVLNKMPFAGLKRQFSDIRGAQNAVDQLAARQKLYDTFSDGLGMRESDAVNMTGGSSMLSPAKFDNFVQKNQSEIATAYGRDGADRINQINDQLKAAEQTARARVPGQSGTPQAMQTGTGNVLNLLVYEKASEAAGDVFGALTKGVGGTLVGGGIGGLMGVAGATLIKRFNTKTEAALRGALLDPNIAKALLVKYNPKMPTPAGTRALNYVNNHIGGILAPTVSQTQ